MSVIRCIVSVLTIAGGPGCACSQVVVENLGLAPTGTYSFGYGMSRDGTVIGGTANRTSPSGTVVFKWVEPGPIVALGTLPGATTLEGLTLSGDGRVVAGSLRINLIDRATRWRPSDNEPEVVVSQTSSLQSRFDGANFDGSMLVGRLGREVLVWTTSGGSVTLTRPTGWTDMWAWDVSDDGRVIVGGGSLNRTQTPFRLENGRFEALPVLPVGTLGGSGEARAVSPEGTVIVGTSSSQAVLWKSGSLVVLPISPPYTGAVALATSLEGKVVGGALSVQGIESAFLWTESLGVVDLRSYLVSLGLNMQGWSFRRVHAISADGGTVTGVGAFGGANRAFRVTGLPTRISCVGNLNSDNQVDDEDFLSFVRAYDVVDCADAGMPATCPADFNRDQFVDDDDFLIFVVAYDRLTCP